MIAYSSTVTGKNAGLDKHLILCFMSLGRMTFGASFAMVWRAFCED